MISKRVVALKDAYPLGLEHDSSWRIKKGRVILADYFFSVKSKRGSMYYRPEDFREFTNVEKLTGRKL